MAIFLIYRTSEADRRDDGRHAFLVDAADAAAARTAAGVRSTWAAFELASSGQLPPDRKVSMPTPLTVCPIEGDAIGALGIDRGGNRV